MNRIKNQLFFYSDPVTFNLQTKNLLNFEDVAWCFEQRAHAKQSDPDAHPGFWTSQLMHCETIHRFSFIHSFIHSLTHSLTLIQMVVSAKTATGAPEHKNINWQAHTNTFWRIERIEIQLILIFFRKNIRGPR